MVDEKGEWDWSRLQGLLPVNVLERLAACPTPKAHYGADVLGWRWDDNRRFTVNSTYVYLVGGGAHHCHHKWRLIWSLKVPQRIHVLCGLRCIRSTYLTRSAFVGILRHLRNAQFVELVMRISTISFGSVSTGSRMAWGVHFSIWCWLLWKLRCCRILDEEFLEREGIFEKGCRLIAECEHSFGLDAPMQVTEPRHWLWWVGPARGWVKLNVDVAVCLADGRASIGGAIRDDMAMGRDCGMHGSLFDGPPGSIAGRLEEERHHWASMRPTMNRIDDPCG
ncbi:hypothetical protein V6N12_057400 [Hibiscus sabdariffa]|uniref:Uncharacterized protein n=1 Tax=Hibiscus sabdariffa TaxID=183260 RepID=A0ABR2DCM7_9ROSI